MPRPAKAGHVWVRTIIVHGKPDEKAEIHKEMPAAWDMATLRAVIAKGYGWAGFGMPKAWELDAMGDVSREVSIGSESILRHSSMNHQPFPIPPSPILP